MVTIADDSEMSSPGLDISPPPPVEEVSAPSDATATDSSSSVAPEPMEDATFDDVSYE